jgi:Zn-dependent metalloprotease
MKRTIKALVAVSIVLSGSLSAWAQVAPPDLKVRRSTVTGLASFVTARDGGAIPLRQVPAFRRATPDDFLKEHGQLFGVIEPTAQLTVSRIHTDLYGFTHTTYQQKFNGVEVFSGVLKVHQNQFGAVLAANGHFYQLPDGLNTVPTLTAEQAAERARATFDNPHANPGVEETRLVVVDQGWYGSPATGPRLAHYMILTDIPHGIRDAFFVDAHTGKVLDHWTLMHAALDRVVVDDSVGSTARTEGDPPTGNADVDAAYDYTGDTYAYLLNAFGRDGLDGFGATMTAVVHLQSSSCPNAFGGGTTTWYCTGTATDDIVAHEWTHGLTNFTAGLIYRHQSGQLNESYSDVIGELVDLLNGDASLAGPPGGSPSWPVHDTGPGTDTPNDLRTGCALATLLTINAPGSLAGDYPAQPASFGPPLDDTGITEDVVVADPARACNIDLPFNNAGAMAGKIVLVDRGDCNFTEKVLNVQNAGGIAAIVANNVSPGLSPMGGSDPSVTIPSVGSSQADGNLIKDAVQTETVNVTLRSVSSLPVRWLMGEDATAFGGAIRDMWQPSCKGHPDTANHLFQTCNPNDGGGVHSGSGVPNHAFAILTDGKTYNGYTVNGIGLFKAGAVWYRALTVYLTPASGFQDAYLALNQSATDLIGTTIFDPRDGSAFDVFTAGDAAEVDKGLLAVEMDTPGRCGNPQILDTTPQSPCDGRIGVFFDDFESGTNGWTTSVTGPSGPPTPYNWVQTSGGLPFGQPGTVWFVHNQSIGDCGGQDETAVHSLFSPTVVLPGSLENPRLSFNHYVATEAFYDGGNIKINVNAGGWQTLPRSAFIWNQYNGGLRTSGNTNPMAGQEAFTGVPLSGGGWGTSIIDLSGVVSPGDQVQFRFDFGKDGCAGADGWYVDDFDLHYCLTEPVDPPVPGLGDDVCHPDGGACSTDADCPANNVCGLKNRYLSFTPGQAVVAGGIPLAIQVTVIDNPLDPSTVGDTWWAGPEMSIANAPHPSLRGAPLECTTEPHTQVWTTDVLHLFGPAIVPTARYEVRHCIPDQSICSDAIIVGTGKWGDVTAPFGGASQPNFGDVSAILDKFRGLAIGPDTTRTDLIGAGMPAQPNLVDQIINFSDVSAGVDSFRGLAYPYTVPSCP